MRLTVPCPQCDNEIVRTHTFHILCLAGAFLSCQGPVPPESPTRAISPVPSATAPLPSAPASAIPAPAPSAPASSSSPDPSGNLPSHKPPKRVGTRTPGQIQCGLETEICSTASQICCIDPVKNAGQCKPKGAPACGPVSMQCDDASDCPAGQACCVQNMSSGDSSSHAYECAPYPCNVFEVCIPGGACSRPEFDCVADGEYFFGDVCSITRTTVACGGRRCSGTTNVCCFDTKTRQSRCVATPEDCLKPGSDGLPTAKAAALYCASPEDCSGYPCAHGPMMNPNTVYRCSSRWATGDIDWTVLCRTSADCPQHRTRLLGCKASRDLPASVKYCEYAPE